MSSSNPHPFPNSHHIEAQLSHIKEGTAGVYNKAKYLEQRRTMMQWYADHLDDLERDNVVPVNFGKAG